MQQQVFEKAFEAVRKIIPGAHPLCAVILGSGFAELVEAIPAIARLPYSAIPGLGQPGVDGHPGHLLLLEWGKATVLVFQGRRHAYEGVGWEPVALPVYLTHRMGAASIILTNAAGAVNEAFTPGDLMVIEDHINAMGSNPLTGPHDPVWGPRFPDQSRVYCPTLRRLLDKSALELDLRLQHGIYAAMAGPAYETPAEIRALRILGADAVGMSTVPEASLAHAIGLRVAGLSCISNMGAGIDDAPSHEDVVAVVARTRPALRDLLTRLIEKMLTTTMPT